MKHIAIDLGTKESQICVRERSGAIVREFRCRTARLGSFFQSQPPSRVVLETSCEAFAVADLAREAQHEVVVMPAVYTPVFTAGSPNKKNDVIDARGLSQASVALEKLPSVHIPSEQARRAKALCASRELLVRQRTQLCNHLRSYFRSNLKGRPKATSKTLAKRIRSSFGSEVPVHIELVLEQLEGLSRAIVTLDRELEALCAELPAYRRLRTVPGVGPVTAVRFAAAIDDIGRFSSGEQVASYFGLTPGENTTGFNVQRTAITKAGSTAVRRVLVQAAWSFWRQRPNDPVIQWTEGIAARRGRQIAVVALAAKMCRIMFAILRDQRDFDRK